VPGRSISVFFPAYNECTNLGTVVTETRRVLQELDLDYEIIIVDDGSTDGTSALADDLAREEPRVRVVHHESNRGFGVALGSGLRSATKELVFYTDADNQFNVDELKVFLPALEDVDMVLGYRLRRQDPWARLVVARVYNWMIRLLFGLRVRDIDCSFKLFRRSLVADIDVRSQTGLGDAEILIKALKAGARVRELPVSHFRRMRGTTTYEVGWFGAIGLVKPSVPFRIVAEILLLWPELRGLRKALKARNADARS
jgi:glycosyltransferase involved in cell wall biosynthesis